MIGGYKKERDKDTCSFQVFTAATLVQDPNFDSFIGTT